MGLNPSAQPPRKLLGIKTWGDWANYHHPYNLIKEQNPNKFENNNVYWRVFGNMEKGQKWNPYYRYLFCLHMSLITGNMEEFSTWGKLQNKYPLDENLQKYILETLSDNPIVSLEPVPFKSEQWKVDDDNFLKLCNDINYKKYARCMFKFIDECSEDDAYIILAGAQKQKLRLLEITKDIHGIEAEEYKEECCYSLIKPHSDKSTDKAKLYLFKWKKNGKNRTVAVLYAMSPEIRGRKWIYDDVSHGLVQAITRQNAISNLQ